MSRKAIIAYAAAVVAAWSIPAAAAVADILGPADTEQDVTAEGEPTLAPETSLVPEVEPEPEFVPDSFTIVAGGDVLLHGSVNNAAVGPDGFDYNEILDGLDPWVQGADLALCNFETPVVPEGWAVTGYPVFGVPPEIVRDLANRGWDGCSTATNHTLDKGFAGVEATLDAFDAAGMGAVGSARTETESNEPQLYRLVRGGRTVTVAHLAMTWSTNGIPVPADQPWSVEMVDTERILEQARQARAEGADLVVVSLHAGTEYTLELHPVQIDVPTALAESGLVDLVIGTHPHVAQAIDLLPGGPDGEGMWVAYSLGNMISGQVEPERSTGLLMIADVAVNEDNVRVSNVQWQATVVDRAGGYEIYPLTDLLADPSLTTYSEESLAHRHDLSVTAVAGGATERTEPPTPTGPAPVVLSRNR